MGSIAVEVSPDIAPGNEYKLPRGGREAIRLSAQHHMLTGRQQWMLHPIVAESIKDIPRPRIADVATGTGIWAMELAQQMPHADIVGLDISDAQFCASWLLTSNVTMGLYDLLQPVPLHLRGTFDVVHVRLLLCAGPAVDKSIFIDRFRSLLRPGGWLQWDDLQFPNIMACFPSTTQKNSIDTVSLESYPIVEVFTKYIGMKDRLAWFSQFEEEVRQAGGYANMERYPVPVRPHLLHMETELCLAVKHELVNMLIKNMEIADPAVLVELKGALATMEADVENGVLFSYTWNVCIANKV